MKRKKNTEQRRKKEKQAKAKARKRLGTTATSRIKGIAPGASDGLSENPKFNRRESSLEHYYYQDYGFHGTGAVEHKGWVKCRLLHGHGYSLIVPDQIYLEDGELRWIQPLAFGPHLIGKLSDTEVVCDLDMDVSCGHRLRARFYNRDLVADLPDGSQLFRCVINGPPDLASYATGEARWGHAGRPYLRLFHHTTASTVPLIAASRAFRTSAWNIQGSDKQLRNVAYAYFTPLDAIRTDGDLKKIAMSEGGTIELRRDGFTPPRVLLPNYLETFKHDILQLKVYRCDPAKREGSIDVWIDATVLTPQHVYRHDEGGPVYYEFPHSLIHRIGTEPNQVVVFDEKRHIHRQTGLKSFEYVVVGDCTTLKGLAAPYDEEDTTHVLKLERMPAGTNILDFWFRNANTDLFSGKAVELQEFGSAAAPPPKVPPAP